MNRFNYDQTPFERLVAGVAAGAVAERLRVPVATLGAALCMVGATWALETQRATTLGVELAHLQPRLTEAETDARRAQRLRAAVVRLQAIEARIASTRRDVILTTNTIALIGNGLPPQTWLTSLGATSAGDWTIGGRSTRVDEIGTTLRRVQNLDRSASARLVSIAASGRSGRILDFVIGWERRP